jgi:hypothetical protein
MLLNPSGLEEEMSMLRRNAEFKNCSILYFTFHSIAHSTFLVHTATTVDISPGQLLS